jgi:hypothetical protein
MSLNRWVNDPRVLALIRYRLPLPRYTVTFDRSIPQVEIGSARESIGGIYPQLSKGTKS